MLTIKILILYLGQTETVKQTANLEDTTVEAENLSKAFKAIMEDVILEVKTCATTTDLCLLKLHISLYLQFAHQNTPAIQAILFDLEDTITTAQDAVHFLIQKNLIGYLNFGLLNVFERTFAEKSELTKKIAQYEKKHSLFLQHSFETIVDVFKSRPDLAPSSPAGLPEITVKLNETWRGKSLNQWNGLMQKLGVLPHHIIIKSITTNCFVIALCVLPFCLSAIVKLLQNGNVIEKLQLAGASVTIEPETSRIALRESECISQIVEGINSLTKQFESSSTENMKIASILQSDSSDKEVLMLYDDVNYLFN